MKRTLGQGGGFTLIELMVSITIIAILSTVAVVSFAGARSSARDSKRVAHLEQISLALEVYRQAKGAYPTDGQGLSVLASSGILAEVPTDPRTGEQYTYTNRACGGVSSTIVVATIEDKKNATTKCSYSATDMKYAVVVGPAH